MKKFGTLLFSLFSGLPLAIFAIVTLFVGGHFKWLSQATFWIVWLMTVIPVLVSILVYFLIVKKNTSEFFVKTPFIFAAGVFETVTLVTGTILTILLSAVKAEIKWYMWALELIFIVIYAAVLAYLVQGTKYISENRKHVKRKVFYIQSMVARLNVILNDVGDQQLKNALSSLRDDIRYSDPMSNSMVESLEQTICDTVNDIISRVETGAGYDDCKLQIQRTKSMLRQRNETIHITK